MAEEATLRAQQTRIEEEQEKAKARVIADAKILETARIERETREKVQSQQREIRDRVAADAEKLKSDAENLETIRAARRVRDEQSEISARVIADAARLAAENRNQPNTNLGESLLGKSLLEEIGLKSPKKR